MTKRKKNHKLYKILIKFFCAYKIKIRKRFYTKLYKTKMDYEELNKNLIGKF